MSDKMLVAVGSVVFYEDDSTGEFELLSSTDLNRKKLQCLIRRIKQHPAVWSHPRVTAMNGKLDPVQKPRDGGRTLVVRLDVDSEEKLRNIAEYIACKASQQLAIRAAKTHKKLESRKKAAGRRPVRSQAAHATTRSQPALAR